MFVFEVPRAIVRRGGGTLGGAFSFSVSSPFFAPRDKRRSEVSTDDVGETGVPSNEGFFGFTGGGAGFLSTCGLVFADEAMDSVDGEGEICGLVRVDSGVSLV